MLLLAPPLVANEKGGNSLPSIQLNAILKDAAVLTINGKQQMLRNNNYSGEGYQLIKIDSDRVTLLISGKPVEVKLGAAIVSSKAAERGKASVTIRRDTRGMFQSPGQINGYPVDFLVDTGATTVAINSVLAEKIGIDYLRKGEVRYANTASGRVKAYQLVLNNVSIGDIKLYRVKAAVIEGSHPTIPLLGMSFLQRIRLHDKGMLLLLEEI